MAAESSAAGLTAREPVAHRPARALLGWLTEQEAVQALLGRNPVPTDDLSAMREIHSSCKQAVESRHRYEPVSPVVQSGDWRLEEIARRPDLQSAFAGMTWKPAIVDLRRTLSFQKVISVEGLGERLENISDEDSLLNLCLPEQQPMPGLGAFTDADGKGFTVSSVNPNLRIAAGQLSDALVSPSPGLPPVKMQAITLLVFMGMSYLQVVQYRGRSFVRDGYHRAAGLLRRGVFVTPCIFIDAQSFDQVGTPPGSFTYETLFGDRPPTLSDFWDDKVARSIQQVSVRKVVRVRGEEFVVPR